MLRTDSPPATSIATLNMIGTTASLSTTRHRHRAANAIAQTARKTNLTLIFFFFKKSQQLRAQGGLPTGADRYVSSSVKVCRVACSQNEAGIPRNSQGRRRRRCGDCALHRVHHDAFFMKKLFSVQRPVVHTTVHEGVTCATAWKCPKWHHMSVPLIFSVDECESW